MKGRPVTKPSGVITLTTDFGTKDTFIGQMKGVILSINKKVNIVDITHEIEPFSVSKACFLIQEFYRYYPLKTIHICVVDPGVGSMRRGLVIFSNGHFFIGPDNGIFTNILSSGNDETIVAISNPKYILRSDSATFHGRDVFASVAGWLSKGIDIKEFGSVVDDPIILNLEKPQVDTNMIIGRVVVIDRFGNCITEIKDADTSGRQFEVFFRDEPLGLVSYYEEAQQKGLSCIINSSGFLELFVYKANASQLYDIKEGETVMVRFI
ncbi:MAG: SAM-dependent chlorinase/fluorinase [Thermodesulfovibrionales bacterium]|nr:SAM-dependent chlorinase/fluorinase [Thermodesulfovibrionales bacterium]